MKITAYLIGLTLWGSSGILAGSRLPAVKGYEGAGNCDCTVDSIPGVRKIKDIVIYKDPQFFSSFPSVVKTKDGDILVAFRRAPDRKIFGESYTNHVDPNSYLMMLQSHDGKTWPKDPQLLYAYPFGGSNDPCMLQLKDGTLLCSSYAWAFVRQQGMANLKKPYFQVTNDGVIFLGGYLMRSSNGGRSWQGPEYPPHIKAEINYNALGKPLPAYNRGAMYEGKNSRIYWMVAAHDTPDKTSVYLLTSDDKGITWHYACPVAEDAKVSFNETSAYVTPQGNIIAFLRTAGLDDNACIARSVDGGKTFGKWQSMGFQGHPLHALRLPDNRVLLTYGYRHPPFGIRARILNAECTDYATAPEIILRDDGGSTDIGYPWSVQLDKEHVLVVYYFNQANGTRFIAGTVMEIK